MEKLSRSIVWQELTSHSKQIKNLNVKEQFAIDHERFANFSLDAAGIFLDYSKNKITPETLQLLSDLAEKREVFKHRDAMFRGEKINVTEGRAVLHTALRNIDDESTPESKLVRKELGRLEKCVHDIRSGKWRGYSGKEITDVVNIGIGGSDLGPAMVVSALKPYAHNIKVHFVSNLDATNITETIKYLNPETTLFIISSKTFTTQETLTNAFSAKKWFLSKAVKDKGASKHHFIGVTSKPERAIDFGVDKDNIFPFWDWVGGRFSLWSAIGLSIALAIGMENFYEFLRGAYSMDEHFKTAPINKNMPVILALLDIWNINFLDVNAKAVIPYDQYLNLFPAYLQQLEMESNGKRVSLDGNNVDYKTAPVIWGAVGTNSQHSFHQLLMQGAQTIPVDFILPLHSHNPVGNHHLLLYANCLAQSQALMSGRSKEEILADLEANGISKEEALKLMPHKVIPGNVPSNTIIVDKVEPKTLGALIALYEHKVFVEGVIWQINSFDQWGVELGKKIASRLIPVLQDGEDASSLDGSTQGLVDRYLRNRKGSERGPTPLLRV